MSYFTIGGTRKYIRKKPAKAWEKSPGRTNEMRQGQRSFEILEGQKEEVRRAVGIWTRRRGRSLKPGPGPAAAVPPPAHKRTGMQDYSEEAPCMAS